MNPNESVFVANVEVRERPDTFDGKRVHIYHKHGICMMIKEGNKVLSNVPVGEVEVILPFGISAYFNAEGLYHKQGINSKMWKTQMTETHGKEMNKFAENLIDIGSALKKKAEKIKKTAEKKKRKLHMKASQRSSKATKRA